MEKLFASKRNLRINKFFISLITALVMITLMFLNSFSSINVVNAACSHVYIKDTDICKKCNYANVHRNNNNYTLPFYSINRNKTALHNQPRGSSAETKDYFWSYDITGRVRNEYKNLWLECRTNSNKVRYIWADYLAFDFDTIAKSAVSDVKKSRIKRLGMLDYFTPGKKYDLKLIHRLGVNTYNYKVYANGKVLSQTYTGESLGNILYGYVCQKIGISEFESKADSCLLGPSCLDKKDNADISRGYKYAKTGKWAY